MSLNLTKSFRINSNNMSVESYKETNKQYNINNYSREADEEEAGPNTFEGAVDEKAEAQGGTPDEGGGFDQAADNMGDMDSEGGFGDSGGEGNDSEGGDEEGGFDKAQDDNENNQNESKNTKEDKIKKMSANPLAEINGKKLLSEKFSDLYKCINQTITKFKSSELSETVEFNMLNRLLVMVEGYKDTLLLTSNEEGQLRYSMLLKQVSNILEKLEDKVKNKNNRN